MRAFAAKLRILGFVLYAGLVVLSFAPVASASPFGQGQFGALVPFGSATSISMALSGNVNLNLTSNGSQYVGSGSHTVTVTSTDAVGYSLYAYALNSSNMVSGANTIPASGNSSAAALANNTWGYNLTGSTTNFIGLGTTPSLLKSASGPYETGHSDVTTVTYGVVTDFVRPAGTYNVSVVYTAVCMYE